MPSDSFNQAIELAMRALHQRPAGLCTDIDGTISPIVANPGAARVPAEAKNALRALRSRLETVAVISGRTSVDARKMVGVAGLSYIGNHGMETLRGRVRKIDPTVQPSIATLQRCLQKLRNDVESDGIVVEDKLVSASIHYRNAPDPTAARTAILRAISRCGDCSALQVADGRMVVNLLPPVAINKGTAIQRLARERALLGLVYLGDDVTDLDAFAGLSALRGQGVRTVAVAVTSAEGPPKLAARADVALPGVDRAVAFLTALAELLPDALTHDSAAPSG